MKVNNHLDTIFKAYDIRGTVDDQINTEICNRIGTAFADYVKNFEASTIVVGRDMRPDGAELLKAFAAGAVDTGMNVVDIGLCATEMVYFASGLFNTPGAMFTASHNPVGYNGIKLCGAGAAPIGAATGLEEIKTLAKKRTSPSAAIPGTVTNQNMLSDYVDHVLTFVDKSALRPLRVVVDAANGMAGLVVPAVFDRLPFQLDVMYPELDGTFPNHPADPLQPKNLLDLQNQVLNSSADIGLAFDGDADRVFVVDEKAQTLSGSLITALISKEILQREPESVIIHNLICSASVPEVIVENGGRAVRSRVGHSFMKQLMRSTGAVFGGEHSGHYYFKDNYNADSAMIATLLVLEALSRHEDSFSDLTAPLHRYSASGEINIQVSDVDSVINRVAAYFNGEDQDRLDGLTVRCHRWWFNLRPSNTEPLLRLNLEADTPAIVEDRVERIQTLVLPE